MRVFGLAQKMMKVSQGAAQVHRLSSLGSLAVTQSELQQVELARTGRLFKGGTGIIANAIAPEQAIPTTTALIALYNGEADGGRTYFIDHLAFVLLSGTAAAGAALFAAVSPGKIATAPTSMLTGHGVGPTTGLSKHSSAAKWAASVTLPGAPVWDLVGASFQLAAANVGQGDQPFEIRGGIAIPPGYALGLSIISGAGTTPKYGVAARWAELEVDLET